MYARITHAQLPAHWRLTPEQMRENQLTTILTRPVGLSVEFVAVVDGEIKRIASTFKGANKALPKLPTSEDVECENYEPI